MDHDRSDHADHVRFATTNHRPLRTAPNPVDTDETPDTYGPVFVLGSVNTLDTVGLGTMGVHDPATVQTAIRVGYRHFDTARVYDNESVVGEGIARGSLNRDDAFVATKLWIDQLGGESVRPATKECLDRLGLEYVDLLYIHRPRGAYDPPATLAAFDELIGEGWIEHVGVSNFEVPQLREARTHLDAPIFANQVEYHPLFQPEAALADAKEHDYYLVAYSPLANGRAGDIPEVVTIAEAHETSPQAVCIAWLTGKDNLVVIPKASSQNHLEANRDAAGLDLTPEERARIDGIEREQELFPE